jgi:adenylate cyclase
MPEAELDFEGEGLLEGLEDPEAREARLALLNELAADGVPLEELREAVEAGRLALLPVERALSGDGPSYTAREIAEKVGLGLDVLQRQRAAIGVPTPDPDARTLGDADLHAAERLRAFQDIGLPQEGMLQVARAIGIATSSIAAANRELIVRTVVEPGDNEYEFALRLAAAARQLMPLVEPMLGYALQGHLIEQVRRDVIGQADLAAGALGGASERSICFADLIDFTRLGEQLDLEDLGAVVGRLEEIATAISGPSVRLVKMIGDAAMLVSDDPIALLDAALTMVEAVDEEGEDFPQLRAGVAHGGVISQGGDVYGRPVNLASRITAVARPGSVLAGEAATDAAGEAFHYSFAGERRLKGIKGGVRLYRVRREAKDARGDADRRRQ